MSYTFKNIHLCNENYINMLKNMSFKILINAFIFKNNIKYEFVKQNLFLISFKIYILIFITINLIYDDIYMSIEIYGVIKKIFSIIKYVRKTIWY